MEYIEALTSYTGDRKSLFLAGGISDTANWQRAVIDGLTDTDLVVLNPRRANFPMDDPSAAPEQIAWEHRHLRQATAILFWFPPETLCPIALYELGAWSRSDKPLFVGTHPDYQRRSDVVIQTRLARPEITVVDAIPALLDEVRRWLHVR
jgi:hypothetical protein